jgi:hypothetical protein
VGSQVPSLIGLVSRSGSEEKLLANVDLGSAAWIVRQQVLNCESKVTIMTKASSLAAFDRGADLLVGDVAMF